MKCFYPKECNVIHLISNMHTFNLVGDYSAPHITIPHTGRTTKRDCFYVRQSLMGSFFFLHMLRLHVSLHSSQSRKQGAILYPTKNQVAVNAPT